MYDDYLIHYGVKGMKWGVRRYQNKDGSLTKEGKERYDEKEDKKLSRNQKIAIGVAATAAVLAIAGGVYMHNKKSYLGSINSNSLKLGKYIVDEMSSDTVIPKGSKMFRTTDNKNLRESLTYTSFTRGDKNRYIIRMGQQYKPNKVFQMKLKTLTDIKVPSEKKQFDMFVDLLTNDEEFSRTIAHNPYGKTEKLFGNRKLAEKFASDYHYDNFISRMVNLDTEYDKDASLSKFKNYVKSKGYNGMLDINDIRTTSEKPLIIFDTKDNLKVDSVKKVNAGMKFVAGLNVRKVKV